MTNTATEANIHATLGYTLVNPPAGAAISPAASSPGRPPRARSPSTNIITTVVTNTNPLRSGQPALERHQQLHRGGHEVEVNVAPVLPVIATQTVNELTLLTVTNTATETNIHATLGYTLVNPPAGAAINTNGIITWTPTQAESPSTNIITTVVTNTNPSTRSTRN